MKNVLLGLGLIVLIPAGIYLYKYLYPGSSAPDRCNHTSASSLVIPLCSMTERTRSK